MSKREKNLHKAQIAERCNLYKQMVKAMRKVVRMNVELTAQENNLLSTAYKKYLETRRASWRLLTSIETNESDAASKRKIKIILKYKVKIENELQAICADVQNLLSYNLIPKASTVEAKVFYFKMKGDYRRYEAEFVNGKAKEDALEGARVMYNFASHLATKLPWAHPFRLGLALNFSVFYYENLHNAAKACELASEASKEAIKDRDTLSKDQWEISSAILDVIEENLMLWTSTTDQVKAEHDSVNDREQEAGPSHYQHPGSNPAHADQD